MMFRLPPPPPRFTLPPPPMFLSDDIIDRKILFQLTCSSIRQQQQYRQINNSRLIIISCISFLIFILLFIIIQFYRRRKSLFYNYKSKPSTISNNETLSNNCSYETISTEHTGTCIQSIDTSATTISTDLHNFTCLYYQQERDYSNASSSPYYHTLEIPFS
ncbi:unnamed protein product [Rotaria sp. Silwood1]|nr:unnamed protein product [Rotaria sp. Silwood1]CAF0962626.1 unnamed protein product [Rotaria sp. Silwood1]